MKAKRKTESDEEQGGAAAVSMRAEPLTIEDARALVDTARIGGGVIFVARPQSMTVHILQRLERAGRVEKQPEIAGGARVRLTAAGIAELTNAAKLIAQTPGVRL